MHRVYRFVWVWLLLLGSVMAGENFIVLSYGSQDAMMEQRTQYEEYMQTHAALKAKAEIKNLENTYMLQVGPFERNDALALSYMQLKELFPHAVIIEKKQPIVTPKALTKPTEKKVYVEKKVFVEKVDDTLWIALFGLAIVGILFMFLSSDQIKRLKAEHEKIKSKHKKLEQKQHEVLSSMGENIHTIAKETMSHTSIIAEKIKETPLYEEMEKVMYNENELLDVTEDLIKFLRLKSKKVVIQNEVFNFNHVLNEVAGLLNHAHKQNDMELVFDIDKEVPRFMLADSLHMGQILSNLLEYMMQNTHNKEMKLEVTTQSSLKEGQQVHFKLMTALHIDDIETLFDSYYDEGSRRYVGLGLFVANELTHLMDGTLKVIESEEGHHHFLLTLPIEEKNREKRKYRLPDKGLVGKKILIVDKSENAAQAAEKLFAYFRADVTVLTAQHFGENMPNFALYDIVALNDTLFNFKILEALKKVKKEQALKIISLDNLFSSDNVVPNDAIDISLVKPLTQEYVFDTLIELYDNKKEKVKTPLVVKDVPEKEISKLRIHRDNFIDAPNINLESFRTFKGAHVLIVEDNIINQKVVLSVLGKSEMKLSVANNGEEAVAFMHDNVGKVDFIFMDINMPVMDGYRASELIRNDNRYDDVAIVALTALVSEHEIDKMFDSGMNGYLPKPVRIEKLYAALDLFLSSSKKVGTSIVIPQADKLMKLDGLNIVEGLSNMKDNDIFYKEVLKEFMDAYAQSDDLFEKLVNEQRYIQVKMLCLDMKGLTSTIGAKEMHVIINEIHQHIIYKKPELLHSYISRYKAEFGKLSKSIQTYLAS